MENNMPAALVTGASRGIGAATARLLAEAGYRVAVNYNHSEEQAMRLVQELTDRFPGDAPRAAAFCADVADPVQAAGLVQSCEAQFGRIDLLVNNAGVARQKLLPDVTVEEWDHIFDVNIKAMFLLCRAALPAMIRRHSGKIVNLSSVWGQTGASCEVPYSASKAAVIGFTKALAKEVGPSGIQVNCVAPGVIATDMNSALDAGTLDALREETPLEAIGTPEDVARCVVFLAGKGGDFMTGQVLAPNGGFFI